MQCRRSGLGAWGGGEGGGFDPPRSVERRRGGGCCLQTQLRGRGKPISGPPSEPLSPSWCMPGQGGTPSREDAAVLWAPPSQCARWWARWTPPPLIPALGVGTGGVGRGRGGGGAARRSRDVIGLRRSSSGSAKETTCGKKKGKKKQNKRSGRVKGKGMGIFLKK